MFRNLLRSSRAAAAPTVMPEEGVRIYAVGDIHGCRAELERLLALVDADDAVRGPAARTMLIFLGDVVDRGPDSAGVIDLLLRLSRERSDVRFLKGNHEEVFLQSLDGDIDALRLFCRVGGRETILSYDIDEPEYQNLDFHELSERLPSLVPAAHRDFLNGFEDMVISGDYAFVHAGIRPDVPLEEQRPSDLRWIRGSFISHRGPHPKFIVHGHTISEEVDRQPNRIGIDTGAFRTGRLTALGIEGADNWVLTS